VAGGRVNAPTPAGSRFCLETGDARDDAWLIGGARPTDNRLPD
jgi:hypothetical protein